MEDFSAGAIDVLAATTIIESGIDNPHTNTLIIERIRSILVWLRCISSRGVSRT